MTMQYSDIFRMSKKQWAICINQECDNVTILSLFPHYLQLNIVLLEIKSVVGIWCYRI